MLTPRTSMRPLIPTLIPASMHHIPLHTLIHMFPTPAPPRAGRRAQGTELLLTLLLLVLLADGTARSRGIRARTAADASAKLP